MRVPFLTTLLSIPTIILGQQIPLMPAMNTPSVADLLTIEPSLSIFYSYARELEMSSILSSENNAFTVLVPTNKAVMALSRKPHQGTPDDDHIEISEEEFDNRSKKNIERWVGSHIIQKYPIDLSVPATFDTLIKGKSVHFEPKGDDWKDLLIDADVHIKDIREASNGVIYIIDGTISVD